MSRLASRLVLAATLLGGALSAACDVNDYCLNCATDDGGGGSGDIDASTAIDGHPGLDGCSPTGDEVCDGEDNDCDGHTDEGTLPEVGDACGTDVGECTTGTKSCTGGHLVCSGVPAAPEDCDNLDNDCDTFIDEGDPGGGAICGSDVGECVAGRTACVDGELECQNFIGVPGHDPEICDGKDNDCDDRFDEDLPPLGSCGNAAVGECHPGVLMCQGGVPQCVGEQRPQIEICDGLDNDCQNGPDDTFDFDNDPLNCDTCGHKCVVPHAVPACSGGECVVAPGGCLPGFHDINGDPTDGCEYECDFQSETEACNNLDDDCDGVVDEDAFVPNNFCDHDGACSTVVTACTDGALTCTYGPNVSTDGFGNIIPETTCDEIDNDCDGNVDESHPTKGDACGDGGVGDCQNTGVLVCPTSGPASGPVECDITTSGPGFNPVESCDGRDNDCDGNTDEGGAAGNLADGQEWVNIGNNTQMMKYEASRPDAKLADQGSGTSIVCSRPNVQPWTNIKYPQAVAACASIGARLCTEQEWHRTCSVVTPTTYPLQIPTTGTGDTYIEAEDFFSSSSGVFNNAGTLEVRSWVPDYSTGFSGISALRASPNLGGSGGALTTTADAIAFGPRLDYKLNITTAGVHRIYLKLQGPTNSDNSVWVGVDNANLKQVNTSTTSTFDWVSVDSGNNALQINIAAGQHILSVYQREDGTKIDALFITRNTTLSNPTTTTAAGNLWAYDSNPNTYQPDTCNGQDLDTNATATGNQDDVLATGALGSCDANLPDLTSPAVVRGKIFDLSGNVKEWTQSRTPGANPIRGGASNNEGDGLTCKLSFTLGSDTFFFPNVGFRCCR